MSQESSNEALLQYLCTCKSENIYELSKLLRSKFCKYSKELADSCSNIASIPEIGSVSREKLCNDIIELICWYGSNLIAHIFRKMNSEDNLKSYLSIVKDVVKLVNSRLPKKDRKKIPIIGGLEDYEQLIVEILFALSFKNKTPEEIVQILHECGLEQKAAKEVSIKYGPGLASMGLPLLVKFLGKKTVMNMIQQFIIAYIGKYVSRQAAKEMAKRVALKVAQKTLTRLISWLGWILLATDIICFSVSPARRMTFKVIPYLSLVRHLDRLSQGNNSLSESS